MFFNSFCSHLFHKRKENVNGRRMIKHHLFIPVDEVPSIISAIENEFKFEVESNKGIRDLKLQMITELNFGLDKYGNIIRVDPIYNVLRKEGWKQNWDNSFRTFEAIAPEMCRMGNSSQIQFQNRNGEFETWRWSVNRFVKAI